MIVPNGRRRTQVAQGRLQNQSIYDSDLFKFKIDPAKYAQNMNPESAYGEQPGPVDSKDMKMRELQQVMNQSNSLPNKEEEEYGSLGGGGSSDVGGEFIDISKQISKKVIDALGLNTKPNEVWQGATKITNDGDEVTGITITLTRAQAKDLMMQQRVEKGGTPVGEPINQGKSITQQAQPVASNRAVPVA